MNRSNSSLAERHLTVRNVERAWTGGRICLLAALAVAVLIVYGSLVPFDLKRPDGLNPGPWPGQLRFAPWSRTDFLVNVAVGAPLGFFLMGAVRSSHRRSRSCMAVAVLVIGCVSALLGTAVELLQLLSPTRQSSWNDVLGQGLGAGVGTLGWILRGPSVILWLRHLANEREPSRFAGRLLQLYLPIFLIMQLTPRDTIRAAELMPKHHERTIALPTSADSFESTLIAVRKFAGNVLLNVPIGGLALLGWPRKRTRRSIWRAVLLGISVVLVVEIAQAVVWWRTGGVGDVITSSFGVVIGIAAVSARRFRMDSIGRLRLVHPWIIGAWTLVLVGQSWQPFSVELTPEIWDERLIRTSLVPFASYRTYTADPLQAVHEELLKFLLAVPLGFLLRMAWPVAGERRVRWFQDAGIVGVAMIVLVGVEVGQMFMPMQFPDVTDVLSGTIGVIVGVATGTAFVRRPRTGSGIGSHSPTL